MKSLITGITFCPINMTNPFSWPFNRVRLSLNSSIAWADSFEKTNPNLCASSIIPLMPSFPLLSIGIISVPDRPNNRIAIAVFFVPSSILENLSATSAIKSSISRTRPFASVTSISNSSNSRRASPIPLDISRAFWANRLNPTDTTSSVVPDNFAT